MYRYPVDLTPDDNGEILVTMPDIPEVITAGIDRSDAMENAERGFITAVLIHMQDGRDLPAPSPAEGRPTVDLTALTFAKLALSNAMRRTGTSKLALARRLEVHPPQVDRLLDLDHASRLDLLETALEAMGKRLTIRVDDIAA